MDELIQGMFDMQDEMIANSGLAELTQEAALLKGEIDELSKLVEAKEKKLKLTRDTILKTLDMMELDQLQAHGFTFYKRNKTSVTTPKTPEEKKQLFDFLESKGIFLEMVSVNSMTLNSLYKSLAEEAAQAGILDYEMPGVGKATEYTTLEMRRS